MDIYHCSSRRLYRIEVIVSVIEPRGPLKIRVQYMKRSDQQMEIVVEGISFLHMPRAGKVIYQHGLSFDAYRNAALSLIPPGGRQ